MLVGFLAPPSHEPVTSASICHRIVDDVFFDVALNIEWSDLALPDVPIFETSLDLIAPKLLQILWMAMAGKPDSPATGPLIFLTFFQHAFGFVFGKERFALKYHTIVLVSVEHGPEENTFWRAVKGWPPMASTIMSVCFFLLDHGSVSNVYWIYWCPMHIGSSKWGFPVFGGYDPMKSNFMPRLVLVKSHVLFTLFFLSKSCGNPTLLVKSPNWHPHPWVPYARQVTCMAAEKLEWSWGPVFRRFWTLESMA